MCTKRERNSLRDSPILMRWTMQMHAYNLNAIAIDPHVPFYVCVYGKDTKCTMKSERYGCGKKRPIYFKINFLRKPKRFWILDKIYTITTIVCMRASVFMNTRYTRNCTLTERQCNRRAMPCSAMPCKKSTNNLQLAEQTKTKKENKTHENDTHKERREESWRWSEKGGQNAFYDQCKLCMPKWVPLIIYIFVGRLVCDFLRKWDFSLAKWAKSQ